MRFLTANRNRVAVRNSASAFAVLFCESAAQTCKICEREPFTISTIERASMLRTVYFPGGDLGVRLVISETSPGSSAEPRPLRPGAVVSQDSAPESSTPSSSDQHPALEVIAVVAQKRHAILATSPSLGSCLGWRILVDSNGQ